MSTNEKVQKAVDCGALPLTLSYEEVRFFDSGKIILRSMLNVNSLELGRLTPKQYRVVAGRSKQGEELLSRQIQKVFEEFPRIKELYPSVECVTIPILSRTLLEGGAARTIFDEFEKNSAVPPEAVCFELSSDLLFEDIERVKARFSELYDLNIKIAISELGDDFCPIFRLKNLKFDYAIADEYALRELKADSDVAKGLPEVVHISRAMVIAPLLKIGDESFAKDAGYDAYSCDDSFELSEREVSADEK